MTYDRYIFLCLILIIFCFISLILGIFNIEWELYMDCGISIALISIFTYAILFDKDY